MKKTAVLLTSTLLLVALAAPASAKSDGQVRLLTRETAAVTAGDTAWLAVNWTAKHDTISDFSAVVAEDPGRGVEVTYPTNTATFTGLMNGHVLDEGEIDYTAIQVHVPSSFDHKYVKIDLEVSFVTGDGEREEKKFKVTVPVVQYTDGEHLVQHESTATIAPGDSAWVDVDMTGLAPVVDDVSMKVTGDLSVGYPAYGDRTSLHGNVSLDDGETDTARFRVDTGAAAPGSYELLTEVTYTFAGERHTRPGTVKISIDG